MTDIIFDKIKGQLRCKKCKRRLIEVENWISSKNKRIIELEQDIDKLVKKSKLK
jgi:hypothetical protein